jgi:hypothetical protein
MEIAMATRITQWKTAWIALALTLGLHVADEASTGFLPFYNGMVRGIRVGHPWFPMPTFAFPVWLAGLILLVIILLALTPVVARGARWIRVISIILSVIMIANGLGHIGMSFYLGRLAPGVYSSPFLLVAAVALLVTALRAKA